MDRNHYRAILAWLLSIMLVFESLPTSALAESVVASNEVVSEQDSPGAIAEDPDVIATDLNEDASPASDADALGLADAEDSYDQGDEVALDVEPTDEDAEDSYDQGDEIALDVEPSEEDDAPLVVEEDVQSAAVKEDAVESADSSEADTAITAQADVESSSKDGVKSLAAAKVDAIPNQTYTGSPLTPTPTVRLEGEVLVEDVDYTVSYSGNRVVGPARVKIEGIGAYTGSTTATFRISAAPISAAVVEPIARQAYTGKARKPLPTVVFNGVTLKRRTDYTLTYKNNSEAGTATIIITGKGNFTGTTSAKFRIVRPSVSYRTHVQNTGWQDWKKDGALGGTSGKSLRLEGIRIKLGNKLLGGGIKYRTHVQNIGWQGWKKDGAMSGTSGKSLRLEAIQIKLYGAMAKYYDVYYRVHAQNIGWMGWAKNGLAAGTSGYAWRLESLQIVLVLKNGAAPSTKLKRQVQRIPSRYVKRTSTSYKMLARYGISYQSWGLSDSPMVEYVKLSPNHSGKRNHYIDTITPHYMGGYGSVEGLGMVFEPVSRQASSNYGIGYDGRVGMYVNECNRAWTSGSGANDNRAITIECANRVDGSLTNESWSTLVSLCTDLCMRNGKTRLVYRGEANYKGLGSGDMLLTMHKWFQPTDCPGPWLSYQFGRLADEVNAQLEAARL